MAEIPDVFLLSQQMQEILAGKQIAEIKIKTPTAANISEVECNKMLAKKVIRYIFAKGRRIHFSFSEGVWALLFLGGMDFLSFTRALYLAKNQKIEDITPSGIMWSCFKPHFYDDVSTIIQISICFDDESRIVITHGGEGNNVKGIIEVLTEDEYKKNKFVKCSGLNLMNNNEYTLQQFTDKLLKKKGEIQRVLLGDNLIDGMTSIMTYESLFLAGIHPERNVSDLANDEINKLFESIFSFAIRVIESGGMYYRMNFKGKMGKFNEFALFNRKSGDPCNKCNTPIQRYKGSLNRYSYLCPVCQR